MEKHDSNLFGYSNRGGRDWFDTDEYSDKELANIPDPDGGQTTSMPTAIPSPFARMDLVKTAFHNISATTTLRSETSKNRVIAGLEEEKLVSHSLDIAQLLFMKDSLSGQRNSEVTIITWDRERELAALEAGPIAHRRFAATLRLYLEQDKDAYNFQSCSRIYLVKFRHEIVGGTSPATLFFCTAKNLDHISAPTSGNDILFDSDYTPLYERDPEFQIYLYQLRKDYPSMRDMKELIEYLDRNEQILKSKRPDVYERIQALQPGKARSLYDHITGDAAGDYLSVHGVELFKQHLVNAVTSVADSDFVIDSQFNPYERQPLVLQNQLNRPLKYVDGNWAPSYDVAYYDPAPVPDRRLPHRNLPYPYLTVSDFLEPYLIRVPYAVDSERYFTGAQDGMSTKSSTQYLLPLTEEFFKFYAVADLASSTRSDGKPILTIKELEGSVQVTLKIPIRQRGEYVSFERSYRVPNENETLVPNERENQGVVVDRNIGVTIFPFIKVPDSVKSSYRVQTIDADRFGPASSATLRVRFFGARSQQCSDVIHKQRRKKDQGRNGDVGTDYYIIDQPFELMQVYDSTNELCRGVVAPLWHRNEYRPGSSKKFRFAVDFGTTNTHIEYTDGEGQPRPFDITTVDQFIAPLFYHEAIGKNLPGWGRELYYLVLDEFLPFKVGKDAEHRFPRRTVIAESPMIVAHTTQYSLADYNIPFTYETRSLRGMKFQTNLKWGSRGRGQDEMRERVSRYIETLVMLMRSKVIMNGGDLSSTEIVWFFPSSMTRGRQEDLGRSWREHFDTYFRPRNPNQIQKMPESLAPYYYHQGTAAIRAAGSNPIVSIDIGGGTTDVVVFRQDRPIFQSSFRFAANAIFGDGFAKFGGSENSSFVQRYRAIYDSLFDANKLEELREVLHEISQRGRAQDIHAFFFSVSRNKDVKDPQRFAYDVMLSRDEELKVLFVYFYSAIVYHVAVIMKDKHIDLPRYVAFSGTGSKILSIISSSTKLLQDLTRKIFEDVFGTKYGIDGLNVLIEPTIPKEVTCKGGLMAPRDLEEGNLPVVHTAIRGQEFDPITYGDVQSQVADVVASIRDFNEFFVALNKSFNLTDNFNVSAEAWRAFVEELPKDVRGYVEQAVLQEVDEAGVMLNDPISESPFFFGLKGMIYSLANRLSELEQS
jgi:hypothetical protein